MKPEIEFFSEDVDDIEYLNVGLKFTIKGETVRCVLGAFTGGIDEGGKSIIKGLVEQAVIFVQGVYDGVEEKLILPSGGGAGVDG